LNKGIHCGVISGGNASNCSMNAGVERSLPVLSNWTLHLSRGTDQQLKPRQSVRR